MKLKEFKHKNHLVKIYYIQSSDDLMAKCSFGVITGYKDLNNIEAAAVKLIENCIVRKSWEDFISSINKISK